MRILHCCLSNFYIDNYGYQENILTKMHKLQGHHVKIVASTETFGENLEYTYVEPSSYVNEHGIEVTRLPYRKFGFKLLTRKLRVYKGLTAQFNEFKPDIIFLHGISFGSTRLVVRYLKNNQKTLLFADNHADQFNSGSNWLSRNVLHRLYYKPLAKMLEPYLRKIFGVLPLRVDFLIEKYGFLPNKVELLNLGFDDTLIDLSERDTIRKRIREKLEIVDNEFVLITGGKLDVKKRINLIVNALNNLNNLNNNSLHLIIFGKPVVDYQVKFNQLLKNTFNIHFVGWLDAEETMAHILAADLAVFPGSHSVLWEMAVGLGIPSLFKEWDNMYHLKLSDRIDFLKEDSSKEIEEWVTKLINEPDYYNKLKKEIESKSNQFKYSEIAKRSIQLGK